MASGIDWFRWHHGSVTDPKFALVAKKANCRVSDVLAMWAFLLEAASTSEKRGTFDQIDFESVDFLFGFDDGQAEAIFYKLIERGLIDGSSISSWDKRQPKRERPDESSTERVKRFRSKNDSASESQETPANKDETHVTEQAQCNANETHVTPCNAMKRHETPRGEERREEKNKEIKTSMSPSATCLDKPPPDPSVQKLIADAQRKVPDCPQERILAMYHRKLPMLTTHNTWSGTRADHLRARWRWLMTENGSDGNPLATTTEEGLAFFSDFFDLVNDCPFLLGQADTRDGRPFTVDLEWLVKPGNWAKVLDGKYVPKEVRA